MNDLYTTSFVVDIHLKARLRDGEAQRLAETALAARPRHWIPNLPLPGLRMWPALLRSLLPWRLPNTAIKH
ncbi:MAG: hypothetical protein JNJ61_13495 [Anaerolineae bacterium]|nr:hypothetical protein [Anaerolineae bacterium]